MTEQESPYIYAEDNSRPPQRGLYEEPQSYVEGENSYQLIKVLTDHETTLDILKMQLRGEIFYQEKDGERYFKQVDKPAFVVTDEYNNPVKVHNPKTNQDEFVPNDEGINEIVKMLKLCGLNPVSPMTTIDENEIRADLFEMESKLAVTLFSKRKKWGIDKSLYPKTLGELKVLLKDTRYRSKDGIVLKALRTITSRIEQEQTHKTKPTFGDKVKSIYA